MGNGETYVRLADVTEEAKVARTQFRSARVPGSLENEARAAAPELANLEWSTLVRAGLASLAGHPLPDAIALARLKPGRPRRRPLTADSGVR